MSGASCPQVQQSCNSGRWTRCWQHAVALYRAARFHFCGILREIRGTK